MGISLYAFRGVIAKTCEQTARKKWRKVSSRNRITTENNRNTTEIGGHKRFHVNRAILMNDAAHFLLMYVDSYSQSTTTNQFNRTDDTHVSTNGGTCNVRYRLRTIGKHDTMKIVSILSNRNERDRSHPRKVVVIVV